jgi:hypothetical protein
MKETLITMTKRLLIVMTALFAVFLLAACGTTPTGTDTDAGAAGNFLPGTDVMTGYTITEAESITDAITAAAGQGANVLDNAALSLAVERVDAFIECYTDVGAVAANIYTEVDLASILSGGSLVPGVGTVAVVNQDRVQENFIACATAGDNAAFSAQSATEICQGSGTFTSGDDTFRYIYISTKTDFCTATENHFAAIGS